MKTTAALTFGPIATSALAGCSRDIQAKDQPQNIEQQYGVSGADTDAIPNVTRKYHLERFGVRTG